MQRLLFLAIASSVLFFASCDKANLHSVNLTTDDVEPSALPSPSGSDDLWATVIGGTPELHKGPSEPHFDFFIRAIETANLHRRQQGLNFWDEFPSDSRRYTWLLETVLIPPHYALDFEQYADGVRENFEFNTVKIDVNARSNWLSRYPELRASFFAADSVTEEQRRLFWYGELIAQLRELRSSKARGESADPSAFVENYLAFVEAYPIAFPDNSVLREEESLHRDMLTLLWDKSLVSLSREVLGWTPESVSEFLDKLEVIGAPFHTSSRDSGSGGLSLVQELRMVLDESGALPPVQRSDGSQTELFEGELAWSTVNLEPRLNYRLAIGAGNTGWLLYHYFDLIERVRSRAVGQVLWSEYPSRRMQWRWLYDAHLEHYFGFDVYGDALRLANDFNSLDLSSVAGWEAEWEIAYQAFRQQYLESPLTTASERASIDLMEIRRVVEAMRRIPTEGENAAYYQNTLREAMEMIHQYHSDHATFSDRDPFSRQLVSEPDRFGLGMQDLIDFVEPYRESASVRLLEAVEIVDRRLAFLSEGSTVELQGPVFDGGQFDLSSLRGDIVYIDSWTTTCASCIVAMPELHETYLDYKERGFSFVSVVYNGKEDPSGVQRFIDRMELTWPVVIGDDIEGPRLPYLLLNRDGTVYAFHDRSERDLKDLLDEVLALEE